MPPASSTSKPSQQFWILALFLLILFATGGSSRPDVHSLAILRPASIVTCALACMTLQRKHLTGRGWLLGWAGAILFLVLLHSVLLPPSLWHMPAGRPELMDVDKALGFSESWRPLSLVPWRSWSALSSLLTPISLILLGIQINRHDMYRLLQLVIALATVSGLLGLLQVISDPQGPLYFYAITNNGWTVGLFANRNHAATLLTFLFPMLAVYGSSTRSGFAPVRINKMIAAAIAILLVPLILVAGSRSGLVSAVVGLGAAALLYGSRPVARAMPSSNLDRLNRRSIIAGGVIVAGLGFLTYSLSRAKAIERLLNLAAADDERGNFWALSVDLFWQHFPWGSGSGSFAEAYQIVEPTSLLDATYLNRAHNDWAESIVNLGLPGLIFLLVAGIAYCIRSYRLWRSPDYNKQTIVYGRLASVLIAMFAIASASDYPLRTPTMMGLFAIFAMWFNEVGRNEVNSKSELHRADPR